MKPEYIMRMLQNLPLFRELGEGLISKMAARVRLQQVVARTVLYRKGDPSTGFFVVCYGRIRLSLFSGKGMEKPIQIAGPGNSFGEGTMFQQIPHYTTAIALEDSSLIFIPQEVVSDMLQSDWRSGMRLLANLSHRMQLLVDDIDDFTLQPPAARLASYLLRLVPPGSRGAENVRLVLKKNLLAAQLNLTPATLSRYFREFSNQGLIAIHGSNITIFNAAILGQLVAHECDAETPPRSLQPRKVLPARPGSPKARVGAKLGRRRDDQLPISRQHHTV